MKKRYLFHKSAFKMIGTMNSGKYRKAKFSILLWTYELITVLVNEELVSKGNLIYILQSLEGIIYIFRHNERNSKIKLLIYKIMNSSISLKSLNQRRTYKFQTFDLRNQLLKELKWPDFLSIIWKLLSITWLDKLLPGKKRFSLSSWKYRISPPVFKNNNNYIYQKLLKG